MVDPNADPQFGLGQILQDKGFKLGRDFSYDSSGHLLLGEDAKQAILADMPEAARPYIERALQRERQPTPAEALEQHLGVSFFDNLRQRLQQRAQQFEAPEALLDYLTNIIQGMTLRHPEFEDWLYNWLLASLPRQVRDWMAKYDDSSSEALDAIEGASGMVWIHDLVAAAGGDERHYQPDGGGLSLSGMQLLSQVWEGNRYSVRELAAAMEQHER